MTSDAVKALADKYFLTTGDKVRRPPPKARAPQPEYVEPPADFPPYAAFWRPSKRELFREWGIHALWVAGPKGPISRGIGDNRVRWPLRMGSSGSYADTVTKQGRSWWPYEWLGVWFRVWVPSVAHVQHLTLHVLDVLEHEKAQFSWIDVAPEFDIGQIPTVNIERDLGLQSLPDDAPAKAIRERNFKVARAKLERFIHAVAARHDMPSWGDMDVDAELDRRDAERKAQEERMRRAQMAREVGQS